MAAAARRAELLAAASEAETQFREAQAGHAPDAELRRLALGLGLAELALGLARGVEKFRPPARERRVGRVALLRFAAGLLPASGPTSHGP